MLVQDGLQRNGRRRPDKIALVCAGQRLTYAEVDAMADRLANALLAYGVKRGDRVGIYLHNTVEAVVGIFGALKAGATFVVINRAMRFEKLCCILANCQATALVTDSGVSTQGTVSKLLSRSEEHTSELQSRFGISYAVFW